jgi:hypothetical protein
MSKTTYTYTVGGTTVTFTHQAGGEFERWFEEDTAHTESYILRGTSRRLVIDVGGVTYSPLRVRAEVASEATIATLRSLRAQQGTLSNSRGRSASAILLTIRESEPNNTSYGRIADLTFKRLQ